MIPSDISRHIRMHGSPAIYWDIGALVVVGTQVAYERQARRYLKMVSR